MKKIKVFFTAMALVLSAIALNAQNVNVRGSVVDGSGDPVVGASVIQILTFKIDLATVFFAQTACIVKRRRTTNIIF